MQQTANFEAGFAGRKVGTGKHRDVQVSKAAEQHHDGDWTEAERDHQHKVDLSETRKAKAERYHKWRRKEQQNYFRLISDAS